MPGASCLAGQQPACVHAQSWLYLKPNPQDSAVLPTLQKHPNQDWNEFAVSVLTDKHITDPALPLQNERLLHSAHHLN